MMDLEQIRAQIPALQNSVYLQTAGIAPSPQPVQNEVMHWLNWQNATGPAVPEVVGRVQVLLEEARATMAGLLSCHPDEIALGHNVTDGILVGAWSRNWQEGDEVILTDQEHPANLLPWYNLRDRYGIRVRFASAELEQDPVANVSALINERTRMISISHVSRETGRILPVQEVARLARRHSIRLLVDGAQALGAIAVDLSQMDCDYYAWSGHKWLLGPKGTGGLYVRRAMLEETLPSWIGSHSESHWDRQGGYGWLPRAARFEYGTQGVALYAGLIRAIRWQEQIGLAAVRERVVALDKYLVGHLQALPGVELRRPADHHSGIVVFRLPSHLDNRAVCQQLWNEGRFLLSTVANRGIRVTAHFFNTESELDALAGALARITNPRG